MLRQDLDAEGTRIVEALRDFLRRTDRAGYASFQMLSAICATAIGAERFFMIAIDDQTLKVSAPINVTAEELERVADVLTKRAQRMGPPVADVEAC